MGVVLEFLSNREGLDRFLRHVLCLNQSRKKGTNRVNFDLLKVSKININSKLLKVSKITSLKIYISLVSEKLETTMDT